MEQNWGKLQENSDNKEELSNNRVVKQRNGLAPKEVKLGFY